MRKWLEQREYDEPPSISAMERFMNTVALKDRWKAKASQRLQKANATREREREKASNSGRRSR
jgi:hypothetical protein